MALQVGGYQGARSCTSGPQPGAWGYMDWFISAYSGRGGVNSGIYNCRSVRGGSTTSLHGEGRACDFGIRPYSAAYGTQLANALVNMSKELGIQCVIWNRRIWSASHARSGWRRYSGVNPHVDHLHVELMWWSANQSRAAARAKINRVIGGGGGSAPSGPSPTLQEGDRGEAVKTVQRAVGADVDGIFGSGTKAKVIAFQRRHGLDADGIVGPATWAVINKQKEGVLGMSKGIYYSRSKPQKVRKGINKTLELTNKGGQFTVVNGAAKASITAAVHIKGLPKGKRARLKMAVVSYKAGTPTKIVSWMAFDDVEGRGGTTWASVHATKNLPKEQNGRNLRIRVFLASDVDVEVTRVTVNGLRD